MNFKVSHLLGVTGVDTRERTAAVRWGRHLEWPVLLLALWIPVQWYLEETGTVTLATARYFDWVIWLVFLFETTLLTFLVHDKRRYLTNNWMNLVIIVAGIPAEWAYTPLVGALRNLRLLLMIFLLVRVSRRLREYLAGGAHRLDARHHRCGGGDVRHHRVADRSFRWRRVGWHVVGVGHAVAHRLWRHRAAQWGRPFLRGIDHPAGRGADIAVHR